MAYTYTYADAWNYIAPSVRRHAEDIQAATIANVICCLAYSALLIWFGGWLLSNI